MKSFEELSQIVKGRLSEKRFKHTLGVVDAAIKLAKKYGADVEKAKIAAILHDITKEEEHNKQLKYCEEFGIMLLNGETEIPALLHAYTGAYYAKNILGVEDEEILGAMYYHTTGRFDMTLLEKVIYLADYIEDNRSFEGVEAVRSIAYDGIDAAMEVALKQGMQEVMEKGGTLHFDTVSCYSQIVNNKR